MPRKHKRIMTNPLRAYLLLKGLTGTEFADRIGVHQSVLSRLMDGKRQASLDTLLLIEKHSGGQVTPAMWLRWWRKHQAREMA